MSRNMQFGKIDTLMGMSAGDVVNAQKMQAAGNAQMMAGIGDAAGGIASFAGQAAGWGGGDKITDVGKMAELPGGGDGGVSDLLGQLGGMDTINNMTSQQREELMKIMGGDASNGGGEED